MMIKKICLCLYSVLDGFSKSWKAPVSFVMSACMSAYVNSAPTGRICVYVGNFYEDLSQNYIVRLKSDRMWNTSIEDISRVCIVDSDVCSLK